MSVAAYIPVRLQSSRLPKKAILKIGNKTMVEHVFENTLKSKIIKHVFVATCDLEIYNLMRERGANVIMTSRKHKRATDRVYEAYIKTNSKIKKKIKKIVMVQGDDPMLTPKMIEAVVKSNNNHNQITNICNNIKLSDAKDPNRVKVVVNNKFDAIYFSREPISYKKKKKEKFYLKQGNIFCFSPKVLRKYCSLPQSKLEIVESVDMNRYLENDIRISMVLSKHDTVNVDTYNDLKIVRKLMK
tara:strand:- start:402 stop:1130 length:729 start_codon:yes stop_codon:yes gene_type:complete